MSYYLVTGIGHELESYVLQGTGEVDGGYIRVGIGGDNAWVLEDDLTAITYDDFNLILSQAAYGERDRLNEVYEEIADGTYEV